MLTGLRQRKVGDATSNADHHASESDLRTSVKRTIAKVDLFPKAREDYRPSQQTQSGAVVSAVSAIGIFLITASFAAEYATGGSQAYRSELTVDVGVASLVPINLDITFPSIQCGDLTLDVMDVTGQEESDSTHDLVKTPVDFSGHHMTHVRAAFSSKRPRILAPRDDPKSSLYCGRCNFDERRPPIMANGALEPPTCCNTCERVMSYHDERRLPRPSMGDVEQCATEVARLNPGCNIRGTVMIQKVKGNFHFGPGRGMKTAMGQHTHVFGIAEFIRFNTTHTVHHLSVGDRQLPRFSRQQPLSSIGGAVEFAHPLNGHQYAPLPGHFGFVRYMLQIVPTSYGYHSLQDAASVGVAPDVAYEYSVQLHTHDIDPSPFMISAYPCVLFAFDFHPIAIHNVFSRPPVGRFVVRWCSVIGGVFVMAGLVDRVVAYVADRRRRLLNL